MDNKRVVIYTVGILGIVIFTFILSQFHIFNSSRSFMFIVLLTVIMVLFNEIQNARKDSDSIFLRDIPGLKAVEEAVGRSTEMGRPILYVPGIMDMNEVEGHTLWHASGVKLKSINQLPEEYFIRMMTEHPELSSFNLEEDSGPVIFE